MGGQMINIYEYIRVSSSDQNKNFQLIVLRKLNNFEKNTFMYNHFGKYFEPPQYKKR